MSLSNFYLCLPLVVLKTRWVLVLICSSILLALFVERVDVILCAVDSVSFFVSLLAFCVSLIRSLRNLMDASSATLRAPLVGTGAKRLVTKPSVISEEKKRLSSVLVSNGYPFSFLQKLTKTGKPNNSAEPANEFKATAVLPYVKGLSEQLRRCLQQQGVRAVFKSETTLRSQ